MYSLAGNASILAPPSELVNSFSCFCFAFVPVYAAAANVRVKNSSPRQYLVLFFSSVRVLKGQILSIDTDTLYLSEVIRKEHAKPAASRMLPPQRNSEF